MQLQTPNARRAPKHDGERFTISQLCKRFDLTLRTLRFYEHKGLISPERRVNRRLYRREDAEKVATILALKRFGFSIGEIKKLLDTSVPRAGRYPISVTQCDEQLGILRARLKETSDAIEELTSIRGTLTVSQLPVSDRLNQTDVGTAATLGLTPLPSPRRVLPPRAST